MSSETETTMSPELAQIAAEAAQLNPPPAAGIESGPVEPPADFLVDARGVTDIVAEGLGAIYPSTAQILNEEKRARFSAALAPVLEKYGLSLGVIFGRWGAEINLAFVTATFAVPLAQAIAADRAAERAAKAQAERVTRNPDPQPVRPAADPYNAAFAGNQEPAK